MEIVAGTRPAELGNHDPLAGVHLAELVVELDGVVDGGRGAKALPVGQDMRGDEVDGRGQFRMVHPDRPDFARCHRDRARPLHSLDELDQVGHRHFGAERRFVADDDGVDIAVVPGEAQRRSDFPLVTRLILVDPGADGHLEAKLGRDWRNEFRAAGRRIGADRPGIRRDGRKIGADLLGGRTGTRVRVRGILKWRIGDAGELAGVIRSRSLGPQQRPDAGMHARYEREHGDDGAHGLIPSGADDTGPNLPPGSTRS